MLNERLARVRKERGLTQEALAVKLPVVRQTVSKWENGTAVPDAGTLCRIAEAPDVSAAELLGSPAKESKADMTVIAASLAEINEQLAVRNRRSGKILKVICGVMPGFLLLTTIMVVLNISAKPPVIESGGVVAKAESRAKENSGVHWESDGDGVPLFSQVTQEAEADLRELFCGSTLTEEQLIWAWGAPVKEEGGRLSWPIRADKLLTVVFDDAHYACDCFIEDR